MDVEQNVGLGWSVDAGASKAYMGPRGKLAVVLVMALERRHVMMEDRAEDRQSDVVAVAVVVDSGYCYSAADEDGVADVDEPLSADTHLRTRIRPCNAFGICHGPVPWSVE